MKFPPLAVLEEFFGVPPELHGPDDADLFHNRITFSAEVEGDTVWFEAIPWSAVVHLRLATTPFRVVDFWFDNVFELNVRRTAEDHNLFIRHGGQAGGECSVKIRPHIMIFYANSPGAEDEPVLSDAGVSDAADSEA